MRDRHDRWAWKLSVGEDAMQRVIEKYENKKKEEKP